MRDYKSEINEIKEESKRKIRELNEEMEKKLLGAKTDDEKSAISASYSDMKHNIFNETNAKVDQLKELEEQEFLNGNDEDTKRKADETQETPRHPDRSKVKTRSPWFYPGLIVGVILVALFVYLAVKDEGKVNTTSNTIIAANTSTPDTAPKAKIIDVSDTATSPGAGEEVVTPPPTDKPVNAEALALVAKLSDDKEDCCDKIAKIEKDLGDLTTIVRTQGTTIADHETRITAIEKAKKDAELARQRAKQPVKRGPSITDVVKRLEVVERDKADIVWVREQLRNQVTNTPPVEGPKVEVTSDQGHGLHRVGD